MNGESKTRAGLGVVWTFTQAEMLIHTVQHQVCIHPLPDDVVERCAIVTSTMKSSNYAVSSTAQNSNRIINKYWQLLMCNTIITFIHNCYTPTSRCRCEHT